MAADIQNVKIGACSVTFGGTDLGHTKGGVEVSIKTKKADITVDETGETPRDFSLLGEEITVKVRLAETQVANLANILPMATLEAGNAGLQVGSKAGKRFAQYAKELVLRPIGNTDDSEDVILYKAISLSEVSVPYTNDEERVIEVEFQALWDETAGALAHFGTPLA